MLVAIFACLFSLLRWSFHGHGSRPSDEPCDSNSNASIRTDDASISTPLYGGVHVFHNPENSTCDFVFFHGLHLVGNSKEAHEETWRGGDVVWPKQWLPQKYPQARVLTVSYDASLRMDNENGRMDLHLVAEKLMWELLLAGVGQRRPTVFIAHGFGGLVIKKICVEADKRRDDSRLKDMLDNLKGIFYYSTPHSGMNEIERIASHFSSLGDQKGSLLGLAKELDYEAARLNLEFDQLPYRWEQAGVGEILPTELGNGLPPLLLVKEASSRAFKITSQFYILEKDHFSICKHGTTTSSGYVNLLAFIKTLNVDVSPSVPEDSQTLPPKLVGRLESPESIEKYVQEFQDGRVIGIWGMGGLGKTTAAKAFFNHLHSRFEFTLFAENVKFLRGGCNGDNDEFERKTFAKFHHRGRKFIDDKSRLMLSSVTGKEVLVVLDDVEEESELSIIRKLRHHRISDKSRFLITSRNQHVWRAIDAQLIEFELLDKHNSESLLAFYAIDAKDQKEVLNWKKNSAGKISEHCGRLPLSLEVLGKYLKGKPVDVWEETMEALREKDDNLQEVERVRKVLRVSYDGLEPGEKEMFRDASTIFQSLLLGWRIYYSHDISRVTLVEAKAVWAVKYKRKSKRYWQTLVDRALVYNVPEDSPIQLHEHLKDLGESLSKQEGEVVKVNDEDEMDILLDPQGLRTPEMWQKIRFVRLFRRTLPRQFWHTTEGESMRPSKLEYLWLSDSGVDGKRVVLPPTLLVLCVRGGSALNLCLANCKRLVFLILEIEEVERLPFSFEPFANLVKLSLSSRTIRFLPEEGMAIMPALQELRIKCRRLQKLPESFGSLCQLHIFVLYDCNELKTLPKSFGSLDHLHTLEISGSAKLEALPECFGSLARLHTLEIRNCHKLGALPESFGSLARLHTLEIMDCYDLGALPESFGSLSLLRSLTIRGGKSGPFPESFLSLGLECVSIGIWAGPVRSPLQRLPETFGDLQSLRELYVQQCDSLETLPDTFGGLGQLMTLSLKNLESFRTLPATFGNLRSLQTLKIDDCPNLKVLPDSLGSLEQLRTLKLWGRSGLQALPDTLGRLQCLERIEIGACGMLETLPDSLGSLTGLQELSIEYCTRLRAVPDTIGHLSRLKELDIRDCYRLKTLPRSLVNLRHVTMHVNGHEGYERVVQKYGIQEEE